MLKLKWKKRWFTLAEVIVVCSMFAVIVIWMIFGISRAFVFLNGIRLQVMATNFAREWVEMVYNMRDTNRRKNPWDRDSHRMDLDWDNKLDPWIYTINQWITWEDSFVYLEYQTGTIESYTIDNFFSAENIKIRDASKLSFTGSYSYNSGWTIVTWSMNELMEWFWTEFYRLVRVYGIQNKLDWTVSTSSKDWENNWTPVELRFCVMVFYTDNRSRHSKELCSIMTNFLK